MRIDHVILAATDLDSAAARLEAELGLVATGGGRHDGLGTHNRIVPLGDGYVEILATADEDEGKASPLGRAVTARIAETGDGLMGWAVAVDDVAPIAERLGSEVSTITRQGLSARLTGLGEAMAEAFLPFFISRDHGIEDPGAAGDAGGIKWVELAGDGDRLDDWLGGSELPVRVVRGRPGLRAVGIGERVLR